MTDGKDKGGTWIKGTWIKGTWIKDGHAYYVSGEFVAHLDELNDDPKWNLEREDGSIKVTDTKEAFDLAARPACYSQLEHGI